MPEVIRLGAGELPSHEAVRAAAEAARRGEVVAFPTDTVYGLGTSAASKQGVARIFQLKGRDPDKPLQLLAASTEQARRWVQWSAPAEALARRFWPGGLTMVLPASPEGRGLACCQGPNLAVRVPGHPAALALLGGCAEPWAATSANRAGEPPLADGQAVAAAFGDQLACVIDAGPAAGQASSVVDATVTPARLLRAGAIPAADLLAAAAAPPKALFICTGNTCRSVMAEFLCNKLARDRGLTLSARSAGLAAERSAPIPSGTRAALSAAGIAEARHEPQPVTRELLDWADVVLVMERRHRDELIGRYPELQAKVHTLRGYAAHPGPEDISDPLGRPDPVYAACCREIQESLEAILNRYV